MFSENAEIIFTSTSTERLKYEFQIVEASNLPKLNHLFQSLQNGGQEGHWHPQFPTYMKVVLRFNAEATQGLLALAL